MVQFSNLVKAMGAGNHFKNRAKILASSILLYLFAVSAFGQSNNLSREQMVQDIEILFSTIEEVHPDMYAVYPKEQLAQDIERMKSQLEPSGDNFYFFRQIAPLVVKLGDGHTSIYPPFEPDLYTQIFPFSVTITYPDKKIHVQNDYAQTQNTIPIGAQIMSINNRQSTDIVQEMMSYVSGERDFFKIKLLEQALFNLLLHSLYEDGIFNIEYTFNQEKHSIQVKGISFAERYENSSQQNTLFPNNPYSFKILPDKNIGIIEFNAFVDMDRFTVFLDSTFQVLQNENIGNLIIDIRNNGGGNSRLGDELFQYISHVPFTQYGKTVVKYSDTQRQFHKADQNRQNGFETFYSELKGLRENDLRYIGNVFLLTSHFSFSSAADFSWAFKYFKMGTVVGEETGGMAVGFGDSISQQLSNSGLYYGVSYKKFYNYGATDDNIHGTLPDYNVEADKALDFTIDLITSGR